MLIRREAGPAPPLAASESLLAAPERAALVEPWGAETGMGAGAGEEAATAGVGAALTGLVGATGLLSENGSIPPNSVVDSVPKTNGNCERWDKREGDIMCACDRWRCEEISRAATQPMSTWARLQHMPRVTQHTSTAETARRDRSIGRERAGWAAKSRCRPWTRSWRGYGSSSGSLSARPIATAGGCGDNIAVSGASTHRRVDMCTDAVQARL